MRISARPIAACGLGILLLALAPAPTGDLRGFTAESAKAQRDWEAKFRAIPSPDSLREYMRRLSARPHHVGSPYETGNTGILVMVGASLTCSRFASLVAPTPGVSGSPG